MDQYFNEQVALIDKEIKEIKNRLDEIEEGLNDLEVALRKRRERMEA